MTTLAVSIPDDLAEEASANLGDLNELFAGFLREELARRRQLVNRKEGYSEEAKDLAQRALELAASRNRTSQTREAALDEFIRLRDELIESKR